MSPVNWCSAASVMSILVPKSLCKVQGYLVHDEVMLCLNKQKLFIYHGKDKAGFLA